MSMAAIAHKPQTNFEIAGWLDADAPTEMLWLAESR